MNLTLSISLYILSLVARLMLKYHCVVTPAVISRTDAAGLHKKKKRKRRMATEAHQCTHHIRPLDSPKMRGAGGGGGGTGALGIWHMLAALLAMSR